MECDVFVMYVKGMAQINNEEMLQSYTANSYSKMSDDNRKKLHKNTYKNAFPDEFKNPKNVVKLSDLKKVLG